MKDSARLELEHQLNLYQFYIGSYLKGIAFFLAIAAALLKFALDHETYRGLFATTGLLASIAATIPLLFGIRQKRQFDRDFRRLAAATSTHPISTSPFAMLIVASFVFWFIVFAGWWYIILALTP